jgi:mannose-6-phosphate isomerase-like protein (cupin superfamily)
MHIKNIAEMMPFESAHGEVVYEYMGETAGGAVQHSLAQIVLPPNTSSLKHYHPTTEESYYILAGTGRIILDDESRTVSAGDAVAIPVNAVHQILNDTEENLVFLAVCAPPWTPDCSVFVP